MGLGEGSIYTTIMEPGPKNNPDYGVGGPNFHSRRIYGPSW